MGSGPFVAIGRVVKAHGLKGEVSVKLAEDLPSVLSPGLEVFFAPPPAAARSGTVESVRPGPKGPLVKFSGVTEPADAFALAGATIMVRRDELPPGVEEDFDPVGLIAVDEARGHLGRITDVIVTGANDVWVVDGPLGQVLLPVIEDVILDVDEEAGVVSVRLLPGLIDEG